MTRAESSIGLMTKSEHILTFQPSSICTKNTTFVTTIVTIKGWNKKVINLYKSNLIAYVEGIPRENVL